METGFFSRRRVRIAIVSCFVVMLMAIAGGEIFAATTVVSSSRPKKVSPMRQQFINYAMSLQGVPYVYGGKSTRGFDCSGFVTYSIRHGLQDFVGDKQRAALGAMINCANAQQLYDKSNRITPSEKEPGDLIFFTNGSRVNHVGIYLGKYHSVKGLHPEMEGKRVFISAVSDGPATGVVIRPIDERYWKEHFYGYGRFIEKSK